MNPSPVLTLSGVVYTVREREVQAVEARPAQYDDGGKFLRAAVEARDGYTVVDVTVLTDGGGFAPVVLSVAALEALGGALPAEGDTVTYPVRPFVQWVGNPGRRFPKPAFSAAAELLGQASSHGARVARPVEAVRASS